MASTLAPLVLLSPLLALVAYFDLRFMRIPNALSLIALALFAVWALATLPPDLTTRLAVAAAVFALGFTAFAFRLIGGGDVKFLSVLMLFIPTTGLAVFANVFSAAMLIGIALVLGLRRLPALPMASWKSFGGSTKFPMGVSIALAGLSFPWLELAIAGH